MEGAEAFRERVDHRACGVGVGVDFAVVFFVAGLADVGKEAAESGVVEVTQGGSQKAAVAAKLFDEELGAAGVGEVAASAAADQELEPGLAVLLNDGDAQGFLRIGGERGFLRGNRSDEPGGAGAEDDQIVRSAVWHGEDYIDMECGYVANKKGSVHCRGCPLE